MVRGRTSGRPSKATPRTAATVSVEPVEKLKLPAVSKGAMVDIEGHLKAYLDRREPGARYTSFDYCFNYFQSHREQGKLPELLRGEALQLSCLHLGFYLASWGMLRGSSDLLKKERQDPHSPGRRHCECRGRDMGDGRAPVR